MGMYCIDKTYWIQTNDGQAGLMYHFYPGNIWSKAKTQK